MTDKSISLPALGLTLYWSCLHLNSPSQPRLLQLCPALLSPGQSQLVASQARPAQLTAREINNISHRIGSEFYYSDYLIIIKPLITSHHDGEHFA